MARGLHGGLGSYSLDPPGFFLHTTTCFTLSSRILAYNSAHCYSLIFFVCALYPEPSTSHVISFSSDDNIRRWMPLFSSNTKQKNPEMKFPQHFFKLKEQHCVLRSDCIQILWFLFSYFPSLYAFCSTCSAVWEKCFVCFVLWVANWLGPSACVCPPRPWATPSCLRQRWLYSDLPVKFWLPPLLRLCCVVTRLCAVLMHTHSGWSIPGELNKASGSRHMFRIWTEPIEVSHARIRMSLLASAESESDYEMVRGWPQLCNIHANIKWLMA